MCAQVLFFFLGPPIRITQDLRRAGTTDQNAAYPLIVTGTALYLSCPS